MMKRIVPWIFFLPLFFALNPLFSQVTAQWRGPGRDGIYSGAGLMTSWPEGGPALLWSASGIGKGYSSAVSDGNAVYVTGMNDSTDYLTAFDLHGKQLWQTSFGLSWNKAFPETRTTPTVDQDNIYVVSGMGTLACISAATGNVIWTYDAVKRYEGVYGDWGVCESLLVDGDKLIYTPAGMKTTMVAVNKNTGELIWETRSVQDTSAYVSPRLIEYGNKRIIVTIINKYLLGVDAGTGAILWTYDYSALFPEPGLKIWPGAPKTNTNTPLFRDGNLYITGGYDHVGAMFRLSDDASSIRLVWTDTVLDCHHGGVVEMEGFIYGANWINNGIGNWCCIDWTTGKKMWEERWFNKGAIIAAGRYLYCVDEKTWNIGLVRATPEKFDLISSFRITRGKGPLWSHPTIFDGILYIRHGDELMAYDIRQK